MSASCPRPNSDQSSLKGSRVVTQLTQLAGAVRERPLLHRLMRALSRMVSKEAACVAVQGALRTGAAGLQADGCPVEEEAVKCHFLRLPLKYAQSLFSCEEVLEHMALLQDLAASGTATVCILTRRGVPAAANGSVPLSPSGGSTLEVAFADKRAVCAQDMARRLREDGFHPKKVRVFDATGGRSLGTVSLRCVPPDLPESTIEASIRRCLAVAINRKVVASPSLGPAFCSPTQVGREAPPSLSRPKTSHFPPSPETLFLPPTVLELERELEQDRLCLPKAQSPVSRSKRQWGHEAYEGIPREDASPFSSCNCREGLQDSPQGTLYGSETSSRPGSPPSEYTLGGSFRFEPGPRSEEFEQEGIVGQSWQLNCSALLIEQQVAVGASGRIFRGTYHGEDVAIKVMRAEMQPERALTLFKREVAALSVANHPNVLPFYGACAEPGRLFIVTRYMSGGNVQELLQREELSMPAILRIATETAQGMHFLHDHGIVHRDLKTANILLDDVGVACVGDFGISRLKNEKEEFTIETGTYRWMSPEALRALDETGYRSWLTHKQDVYSFGVVLWELLTGQLPYADYSPMQVAVGVTLNGLRPIIPGHCPCSLKKLMRRCWADDPRDRPEFSQVVDELQLMMCDK